MDSALPHMVQLAGVGKQVPPMTKGGIAILWACVLLQCKFATEFKGAHFVAVLRSNSHC